MRFIVVGTGGVGGLVGGLLQRAGREVAFVARGRNLEALRSGGLRVESPRGVFHLAAVEAAEAASLPPGDVALVCVKAWQVPEVAPRLAAALRPGGFAVPLQNGVEAARQLAAALGEERVAGGLCFLLSRLEAPGRVVHAGESLKVTVGERRGPSASPRLEALCSALREARVDAAIAPDVEAALWEKFVFIEPFGSVGAVTRSPAGAVRSLRETRELLVGTMEEVAGLARARGVRLAPEAVTRALAVVDGMPEAAMASMQRDLEAGRPSELFDQTGAVVRLAREANHPAPLHAFLWAALLPREQAARGARR